MIRRHMYTQQMLARVADFVLNHLDLFPKESVAGDLLQKIAATVSSLAGHASYQVSGEGSVRTTSVSLKDARRAVRTHLELLDRTARALGIPKFFLPVSRSDATLITTGEAWARDAEPLMEPFIKHGLPANFTEELKAAVEVLKRKTLDHDMSKESRSKAIAEFDQALTEAQLDLQRFDALVINTLRDKAGVMAEWKIARRVGRPPAKKKAAPAQDVLG